MISSSARPLVRRGNDLFPGNRMRSALANLLCVLSVLLAGLLAGLQWGTGMAQYTALHLPGEVWLLRHQAEDALFRQVMPGYMWAVLLSLAGAGFLTRGKTRLLFAVAAIFSLLQMIVTIGHEFRSIGWSRSGLHPRSLPTGTPCGIDGWLAIGCELACPLRHFCSRSSASSVLGAYCGRRDGVTSSADCFASELIGNGKRRSHLKPASGGGNCW